ncbi:MAG: PTS sugar transporter subunit IIB [Candidatus Njordarchaeales archaeon]
MTREYYIVTVCGLGHGTALFLRMQVENVLRALNIRAKVETADASLAKSIRCDIIVTAPDLAKKLREEGALAKEIVEIKNYLNKNELKEKLKAAISNVE